MARQQGQGMRQVAAFQRMLDGGHGPAAGFVPAAGRQVKARQFTGLLAQQLCAQEVGKHAVVAPAVPALATLRLVGQRHQEQVGLLQRLQHGGAVGARHQGLADLGIQRAQDAGAQQEVAHGRGLLGQHILGQVVGHGALRARETLDEIAVRAMALQRQRGQPQRAYPAFGLVQQPRQGLARQRAAAQAKELLGLAHGKAQQRRIDLQQLATGAQPPQSQGR